MKTYLQKRLALVATLIATATLSAPTAEAVIIGSADYSDTITAIMGTGLDDNNWVSATQEDVVTAARFRERFMPSVPNDGAGIWNFPVGTPVNLDFSLDSGAINLANLSFTLGIDDDPAFGIADYVPFFFDPIIAFGDNSYGNSGTANGAGTEGNFLLSLNNSIAQNSQQLSLFGLDLSQPGEYEAIVSSYTKGAVPRLVSQTHITLQIGDKPTGTVPDSGGTFMLGAIAFCGLAMAGKKAARRAASGTA